MYRHMYAYSIRIGYRQVVGAGEHTGIWYLYNLCLKVWRAMAVSLSILLLEALSLTAPVVCMRVATGMPLVLPVALSHNKN